MIRFRSPHLIVAVTALAIVVGTSTAAHAQANNDKLDHALREGKRSGKSQPDRAGGRDRR